ncbi:LysR family transcriptional regulator [Rhizobium etli]|uniref:LysR family transcriptional regulator n=1 Tax=Rhizobium etli TaxID=29449 RepID=UPI0003839651|nr:LysR family transcriptional regulator [Rhizobium etli]AGS26607.1 LysR family transcriptional regulator protein [Rhizobium etli bv. mimosae str. Mim1]
MTEQINIDRLTGIVAFARAASLGSYTAAARSLSVSPSAISKSVQRLEERLGVRLFTRTTRSLALTSEGRELHEHALRLLREAEAIEQAAVASRAEPAGLIKVTAPLPVGIHILAPALPRFRALYPRVSVDLRIGDQFADLIEEGIDVAIRVGDLADSRLITRKLGPNRISAFASPAYLERRGVPMRPEDLAQHDCVNFRYQSSGQMLRWHFKLGDNIVEILPNSTLILDNSDGVAAAVAAGGGIGISPIYVAAPFLRRGEFVAVLKDYAIDRTEVTALWSESRRGNPNVKAFVRFLIELFSSPTSWDETFAETKNFSLRSLGE